MFKTLIGVLMLGSIAMGADFVVSPSGNDSAAGTEAAPFATFSRAIRAVREARAKTPTKGFTVLFRGGVYELPETVRFAPEDSGSADAEIVYANWPGETPIFSGGKKLTGWKTAGGRWVLEIPEVKDGKWKFSQLFVNNVRRFRPRTNAGNYLHIAGSAPTNEAFPGEGDNRFVYADNDIDPNWKHLDQVEALLFHRWTMSRLPIDSVDPKTKTVSLRGRTMHNEAAKLEKGGRYLLENVAEALQSPGQWYLDRSTGELTYIPAQGEDPATAQVYAPRLETLLSFEGNEAKNHFISHITLRGLAFRHSNWNVPRDGYSTPQAEIPIRGAIRAVGANFITLDNITVSQIGHYAIDFGDSCADCTITNCNLYDLGAGGIRCGTGWKEGDRRELISSNFTITNNRIYGIGRMHPGAIGIWIGHSPHNLIAHNEIFDTYYTGISVGWRWGAGFSWAHHNTIAHNLIHHVGQGRLDDLGGIYMLGESPGTTVVANHIYESRRVHYCGNGIYLDEGSAKIVVEKNVVHDCDDGTFFMHYGTSNDIRDNVFANSANELIGLGRPEKSGPLYFHDNILVPTNPIVYGDGVDDQYHIDRNTIYWNSQTPLEFPNNMNLQQWQQSGRDQHSTVKHESLDVKPYADATNAGREPTAIKLPATQPVAEGYPPAK